MESRCDTDFALQKYGKSIAIEQAEDPSLVNLLQI